MEVIVLTPAQLESYIARAVTSAMEAFAAVTATAPRESTNLLTVKETAKRLRKSEKTVREYIKHKVLPAVDANRNTVLRPSYSILEADVNAYVKRLRA